MDKLDEALGELKVADEHRPYLQVGEADRQVVRLHRVEPTVEAVDILVEEGEVFLYITHA